jgi:hypothetical protein
MDINDLKQNPEQIKSLISLLSSLLDTESNDTPAEQTEKPSSKMKTRHRKVKQTTENTVATSAKNLFLDMPERNMHKEDVEIDKKLSKYPPTKRSRKTSLIKVVCRVCGKKEDIVPGLLFDTPDRYKCNKCSKTAG